jgi:proteasome lid subunit RPN8/RPN11
MRVLAQGARPATPWGSDAVRQTRGGIVRRRMRIAPDLLQQIVDHAQRDAPDECCGFVWLRDGRAEGVVPVENIAHSPFRFEVGPADLLALGDALDEDGRQAIVYHSHTRSAPRPSQTDVNFAANWPGVEWLIVGVAGTEPEVRNWRIAPDGTVTEVEVLVDAPA